ncbi:MAG: hypothetical protein RLZZ338_2840, partial [Cyanobacteriota bacterium]
MTLAKENPTELNLSEEVVSAAKDDGADQLNQLEPLLRLLMDLNGVEPSRENGKEKSQPQDSQENFQEMIDDRAPVALEWENNSSQPQESLLDGAIVPSSSPCVSPSEIPSSVPKPAPDASEEALEALLDLLLGSSGSKTTVTETPVSTAQETVAEVPEKEAPVLSFLSEIASISPEEETSQLPAPEKELFTEQPNLSPTSENLEKELVTETEKSSVSPSAPEKSTSPQRKYPVETETPSFDIKSDELVDPLSLLQNILMGTQISEVKEVNESLAD